MNSNRLQNNSLHNDSRPPPPPKKEKDMHIHFFQKQCLRFDFHNTVKGNLGTSDVTVAI